MQEGGPGWQGGGSPGRDPAGPDRAMVSPHRAPGNSYLEARRLGGSLRTGRWGRARRKGDAQCCGEFTTHGKGSTLGVLGNERTIPFVHESSWKAGG